MQLPLFLPESGWSPPRSFPNLSGVKTLALDTETRDDTLKTDLGPGFIRGHGHVSGFSLATDDAEWYFPVGHFDGGNLNPVTSFAWLRDLLARTDLTVVLCNAQYDLGWLRYHGVEITGKIEDVQIRETLIQEENPRGYSLDAIANRRLGTNKDESMLEEAARAYEIDPKADMWKMNSRFVGPYAETDARITYDVWLDQEKDIAEQNLEEILRIETALIKPIHEMTWRGVRINTALAEQTRDHWQKRESQILESLNMGPEDIWNAEALADKIMSDGYPGRIPRTPKSEAYSINNEFLEHIHRSEQYHSILRKDAEKIHKVRLLNRCREVFVEKKCLNLLHNGRLHAHFVQLAREDEGGGSSGTRTGRFASKQPNLQQIPKRSKIIDSKVIRHFFLPEEGMLWCKLDFDSQEPRLQTHYGLELGLTGADRAKEAFDKGIKLYTFMSEQVPGLGYDDCKQLVLAKSYMMGISSLAKNLNVSKDRAREISEEFDHQFGFIGMLAKMAASKAMREGRIRSLGGRVRHFDYYERKDVWDLRREYRDCDDSDRKKEISKLLVPVFGRENASRILGTDALQRAFTQKAFNSLIQGGSATQAKLAFLNLYEAGFPIHFPVHDETNISVENEHRAEEAKELSEKAVELNLDSKVDMDLGEHWV